MNLRTPILTLFIIFFPEASFGQQAKLEGRVLDDRDRPASGVRIITPGGQAAKTDNKGHFSISFPPSTQPGQATRIEVAKPNWVVLQPMFGNCVTQSAERNYEPLQVVIVPKGSPLALSPKRLRQVIARWADERAKLRGQVDQYRSQLDEYAFLREYAEKYGLTLNRFLEAAQQWARTEDSSDQEEEALKEYVRKNYDRAAYLAHESALAAAAELDRANQQRNEAGRKVIRRFKLEGNVLYEQNKSREALKAYEEVDKRFTARKLLKEDFTEEWAEIKVLQGIVKRELGTTVEGRESQQLLSESVTEYRQALTVFTHERSPQWAATQSSLGNALSSQGLRLGGEESTRLLAQAAEAYRQALTVFTPKYLPERWASAQINLGAALASQAERLEGDARARMLGQAVEAYRAALEFTTREHSPQEWASAQTNLGNALVLQGTLLGGEKGARLFGQAAEVHRAALQIYTREQQPQLWAAAQNNLGIALQLQGKTIGGEEGARLLSQAVEVLQAVLRVRTREHSPQDWARTQANLGNTLSYQGARMEGDAKVRLLSHAADAYRQALTVFTREYLPQYWATTQYNLANTYVLLSNWAAAAEAYSNALTINPNKEDAYGRAVWLYHEVLFEFDKAFALNQQWLALYPDDVFVQGFFTETHFTTRRFAECLQRINALPMSTFSIDNRISLHVIEIASLLALKKNDQVPARISDLIEEVSHQPADFKFSWAVSGIRHFIGREEQLSSHRDWLRQLFDALAGKDRDTIVNGLRQAAASFKE
jgi:tetratricopeptide (TPR) repeat protein